MEKTSTPRVSCSYLGNFIGSNVMLVGKVLQMQGDTVSLDADGHVTVHLNRDAHIVGGNIAQIVGKVQPDLSIKALSAQDLGLDVDMDLYRKVVEVVQEHSELFV